MMHFVSARRRYLVTMKFLGFPYSFVLLLKKSGLKKSVSTYSKCASIFLICTMSMTSGCIGSRMNFSEGIKSFQVQDYRQAFIRLMPEAKSGNADAQYAIGYMYYYGQGVIENRKKAWYWINCAAKAGQVDAIQAVQILAAPV